MISAPILAAFNFGGGELLIILAIVLLLFGGAKLPALAKGLGQSIKEFKKAAKDGEESPDGATPTKPVEAKKIEPANTHGSN